MKVIALNGSPRKNGNTYQALRTMADELEKEGIETEIISIGKENIHGCIACNYCAASENNQCVFKNDCVNEVVAKMKEADGFILGSPTYYAGIAGTMKAFLDRAFYPNGSKFKYKVATSVAAVRRAGGVDVIHQLNNYLNLAETILPPSQYWTIGYGAAEGEVQQDEEGIQTLRKNARAMAWLLKVTEAGKKSIPVPQDEARVITNFIR